MPIGSKSRAPGASQSSPGHADDRARAARVRPTPSSDRQRELDLRRAQRRRASSTPSARSTREGGHRTASGRYSTLSWVSSMNAASRLARRGVSSCTRRPCSAARSPIRAAGQPADGQRSRRAPALDRAAGALEQRAELAGVGRDDAHVAARRALRELGHARVGDQPPAPDDEHVVGRLLHLVHEVARDDDRAPLGGEALQHRADPADALGIQAVHRLVEEQRRRVAEQRRGDAQPLGHAEREAADAPARDVGRGRPRRAPPRRALRGRPPACGEPAQVLARGALAVHGLGVEQRADLAHRRGELAVARGRRRSPLPAVGRSSPRIMPHRRRLARAVGPEEAGHDAGTDVEAQPVDGDGSRRSAWSARAPRSSRALLRSAGVAVLAELVEADADDDHDQQAAEDPVLDRAGRCAARRQVGEGDRRQADVGQPRRGAARRSTTDRDREQRRRRPWRWRMRAGSVGWSSLMPRSSTRRAPGTSGARMVFACDFRMSAGARDRRRRPARRPARGRAGRACAAPTRRAS